MNTMNTQNIQPTFHEHPIIPEDRLNYQFTIHGELFRVSYLPMLETIVFTQITHNFCDEYERKSGQFQSNRRFMGNHPHESLIRTELIIHLNHLQASD